MQQSRHAALSPGRPPVRRTKPLLLRRSTAAGPSPVHPVTAPLIDRRDEVRELRAALDAAVDGRGHVLLVAGEPGIGKTRLAEVLAADAARRDVPVLWGRGWEDGSAPAFWPWSSGLARWIERTGEDETLAAAGAFRAELGHVFPCLLDPAATPAPDSAFEGDRARFRLFDIVRRFLADLAAPAGLVVVLDDCHWADAPSLRLLEFLATTLEGTRILVVATYRDTEVRREHPFAATLSRVVRERATRRLLLGGLSAEHCAQWLAASGVEGDLAPLGATLHRESNGNPLFLGELVRLIARERTLTPDRLPHGIREVIGRRLSGLGEGCRELLAVAALLGDTIDARALAEVLDDPATPDRLARAAHERILLPVDGAPDRLRFAHALIRRAANDDLSPSERCAWHARIAAVLERRASATEVVTTELVHHFASAGDPASLRKAFGHARRGARQAARGLGFEEAVRLLEIALEVGRRTHALDAEEAIELELELAHALRGAGEIQAARARCAEVLMACRRTLRPAPLARAVLLHVGPTPQFGRVAPSERALLEEAYRGADGLDDALRARLCARLAGDIIAAKEPEQSERVLALCDQATQSAERAGDAGALAIALLCRRYASALRLRTRSGATLAPDLDVASAQQIIAAAEAAGEYESTAALRHIHAASALAIGEPVAFAAEVDALATAAAASNAPEALWLADALGGLRATLEGRFAEAQQLMDRAHATGRRLHLPNAHGQHLSQRIMLAFVRGRLADVADEIATFVASDPGGTGWQPMRALARLAQGDVSGARSDFRMLLAAGFQPADSGIMSRFYLATLGHLCAALGERDHASVLYERIARRREAWVVDGCQTLGPWALVLGLLALTCGRAADAAGHFEQALALSRRMAAEPFVAQALVLLAEARIATEPATAHGPEVAGLLDEAEHLARRLDLRDVTTRLERLRRGLPERCAHGGAALHRDGDVWTASFAGREIHLKDGKGPAYLATLLASPGHDFHVLELANRDAAATSAAGAVADGLTVGGLDGAIADAPDARAQKEYRARLEDLRAELDEAEEMCDRGRAERLRSELEHLVAQLAQSFGGRARSRGTSETARKAVTKVLRTVIARILETHPALGEHLRDAIRMGTFCSYEPSTPVAWRLAAPDAARPADASAPRRAG